MKQLNMKKEMTAWKIMMDSRNNPQLNTFLVCIFMINTILFLMVCLKRMCQYKNAFPSYPVCTSLFMMATCNAFFFRMFFNRTSPCFVKTLPASKAIFTAKLSLLFETINTLFVLTLIAGSFVCFGKGYDSNLFYLVIIFFLFVYFSFSIMLPLAVKFFNNENRIYFSNLNGGISLQALNFLGMIVMLILPLLLINFFAKPLADLFPPLSLHGLTMTAVIAVVVVIASCTANYFMFRQAYKRR